MMLSPGFILVSLALAPMPRPTGNTPMPAPHYAAYVNDTGLTASDCAEALLKPSTPGAVAMCLPPCPTEDSDSCYWDATRSGDGVGQSFFVVAGQVYGIPD